MNVTELADRWQAAFGDCPPDGSSLRARFARRWVRFHSLPGGKRYATDAAERAEVRRRHHLLLRELVESATEPIRSGELTSISQAWSRTAQPVTRPDELVRLMPADYWTSVCVDDSEPDDATWLHL